MPVEFVNVGIADKAGSVRIADHGGMLSLVAQGGKDAVKVPVVTLDEYVARRDADVGYVKMDIEGAELAAFRGMERTLTESRPVFVSAIYHTPEQFFELKPCMEALLPDYACVIRNCRPYSLSELDTRLIAWPRGGER